MIPFIANLAIDLKTKRECVISNYGEKNEKVAMRKTLIVGLFCFTSSSGPSIALKYPICVLHLMQEKHFL